jgi:poly-gamma-glutamate synthase PgsB/CapB
MGRCSAISSSGPRAISNGGERSLRTVFVPAALLVLLVAFLALERAGLARLRRKVPLRVCVTGTRGKSSVTRLTAAALRASGLRVAAKTTGSRPMVIFPDGREEELRRSGLPSILEQKRVLRWAARLGADALVAEMMSIREETLGAESRRILRPRILGITNVRLDHLDDMGRTKSAIAATMAASIPEDSVVCLPAAAADPAFRAAAKRRGSEIRIVPAGGALEGLSKLEFAENVRLALAVAEEAGVDRGVALRGMAAAAPDFGGLKIWILRDAEASVACLSLFAANEPESSRAALSEALGRLAAPPAVLVGLLNLRADRGDRTRQWLNALEDGFFDRFDGLVFIGDHARALGRMRRWPGRQRPMVSAIASRKPEAIMAAIRPMTRGGGAVAGLGNMGGAGEALVEYWARAGEAA